MSYTYLLELHMLVDRRMREAEQSLANTANDAGKIKFQEGRIALLSDFKDFLTENLNPKLPGALRKRLRLEESG